MGPKYWTELTPAEQQNVRLEYEKGIVTESGYRDGGKRSAWYKQLSALHKAIEACSTEARVAILRYDQFATFKKHDIDAGEWPELDPYGDSLLGRLHTAVAEALLLKYDVPTELERRNGKEGKWIDVPVNEGGRRRRGTPPRFRVHFAVSALRAIWIARTGDTERTTSFSGELADGSPTPIVEFLADCLRALSARDPDPMNLNEAVSAAKWALRAAR